uniref:Uncharacterized protein n=1 Tax=Seriola lalandi dorsalis TaxID=1841481 RepID=A0A3B4X8L4_SERLL
MRTHSSSWAMSVSSSHGLTSNRIEDFAMRAGSGEEEGLTSSSEPNRSMSSSSSSFEAAAGPELEVAFFTPGRLTGD